MSPRDGNAATPAPDVGLTPAIRRIRDLLEMGHHDADATGSEVSGREPVAWMSAPLQRLCSLFQLSPFERDIVLLCAAMELDPAVGPLCAAIHGDERRPHPSFQVALQVLEEAHWTALVPQGTLRRWKLIELTAPDMLTRSSLRIAEPVLHFLMGVCTFDERIGGLLQAIAPPGTLPASFRPYVDQLVALAQNDSNAVVRLHGEATNSRLSVAAAACAAHGMRLLRLRAAAIPASAAELELFARLWERDAALNRAVLLIDAEGVGGAEWEATARLADTIEGFVIVVGGGSTALPSQTTSLRIDRPPRQEQRALWQRVLGAHAATLNGELDRIVAQFRLDPEEIRVAGERIISAGADAESLAPRVWEACRDSARPSFEGRALRIHPRAGWQDLVLPDSSLETLHSIVAHVRQQTKVLEHWGFESQSARGLGMTALFCGPSGTGKTLAAEVLARELNLDLYQIDLSQIDSKYIGETEKNLRIVFDAAQNSGAVLLFDEADALFGKRSEVNDSHDRYANIEVSYLLQRMEAYRGLAILTTNMRTALDTAFLRRLRFVVTFGFPDAGLRRRIWQRMFPAQTPVSGLDWDKLAKLSLPGGNIRNIAINAAFMAADREEPVQMRHLLAAARQECGKIERPLGNAEVGGWA
jgi:hypothetical protein